MYGIKTNDIPRIYDYDQAKRHYESVKPIRGKEHIRPIGKRSKHHMRIDRRVVEGMEVYEAILYRTACVTWYPDGRVLVDDGGWNTGSTAAFIHAVAGGVSVTRAWNYICVWCGSGDVYPIPKGGLMLRREDNKYQYRPLNPPKMYVYKYNRAETARLRTLAKPVVEYFKVMRAVMGEDAPTNWREERQKFREVRLANVLRRLPEEPDTETLGALFMWRRGVLNTNTIYAAALEAGLTTYDALYDKHYLPPGDIKKGMKMEHTT